MDGCGANTPPRRREDAGYSSVAGSRICRGYRQVLAHADGPATAAWTAASGGQIGTSPTPRPAGVARFGTDEDRRSSA
jgi:hypothetical protein